MPDRGQKLTSACLSGTSALPLKGDIREHRGRCQLCANCRHSLPRLRGGRPARAVTLSIRDTSQQPRPPQQPKTKNDDIESSDKRVRQCPAQDPGMRPYRHPRLENGLPICGVRQPVPNAAQEASSRTAIVTRDWEKMGPPTGSRAPAGTAGPASAWISATTACGSGDRGPPCRAGNTQPQTLNAAGVRARVFGTYEIRAGREACPG